MSEKCKECGKANNSGYKFCKGCGAPPTPSGDTVKCSECGKSNNAGYKFCKGCGAPPAGATKKKAAAGDSSSSKESAVKCPECGKECASGYRFCKGCGAPPPKGKKDTKVEKQEEVEEEEEQEAESQQTSTKKTETAKKAPPPASSPRKAAPPKDESPPPSQRKAAASTRKTPCEACSYPNPAGYEVCGGCGAENPEVIAASKKKAAEPPPKKVEKKAPAGPTATEAKEELMKGIEFKTKEKGSKEVSTLKAGDLDVGMDVWATMAAKDNEDGWLAAKVVSVGKTKVTVRHDEDGQEADYPPTKLFIRNPPMMDNVADLTQLSYMHEPGLLYVLAERYKGNNIYTFTGTTLIAVNPYARLPMYSKDILDSYVGQPIGRQPPHVFAVGEDAFRAMMDFNEPQSVLVSGESGAGKTETTKVLLQYLAAMGALADGEEGTPAKPAVAAKKKEKEGRKDRGARRAKGGPGGPGGGGGGSAGADAAEGGEKGAAGKGSVEQQVLQSNPVLEAFGNAKTLRNDNSSRFGKFIRIQFDARGHIEGAQVLTYLLEKPRLTSQMAGERNFHIFYQLCKGATTVEQKQLALEDVTQYRYLNQGGCYDVPNVDDAADFEVLRGALDIFGVSREDQKALWQYLSGILHLGNITFKTEGDDRDEAVLDNGKPLAYAAKLLGIKQDDVKKALLRRQATMGKNVVTIRLKVPEAEAARDAFAMLLYGRLFDHLVKIINKGLSGVGIDEESNRFIGVLDIYGFEFFEKNSFEQFCINWANEKLQQQFNQHIFKLEQAEYVREKIDWSYIEFADNQGILSLIEDKSPMGIIPILDEQCKFPKSDYLTFAEKLFNDFKSNPYFEKPKFAKDAFTIDHYAGKVTYQTLLFLDKNRDFLIPEHFVILGDSEEKFVKDIFAESAAEFKASGGSMKFASVGSAFKTSLADLMNVINRTQTHYIRCIKPNDKKKPGVFQKQMSLHQLRCGGVLETVRIAAAGFPTRWTYQKFCDRYRILAPLLFDQHKDDWKACTAALIKKIGLEANQFQLGLTKVFLRAGLVALFEELLKRKLDEAAIEIQRRMLGWLRRRQFLRIRSNAVAIQCLVRKHLAKQELIRRRNVFMATQLQAHMRAFIARRRFEKTKRLTIVLQRRVRWRLLLKNLKLLLKRARAKQAQEGRERRLVVRVQARIRMKLARRAYLKMRAEARDVKGKFAKIMDEKSQLEEKVEELTSRLTAATRAKTRLQEQFEESEKQLAAQREELSVAKKELLESKRVTEEVERRLAQVVAKGEADVAQLQAAHATEMQALREAHTKEIAVVRAEVAQAQLAKANEEAMERQAAEISRLQEELKQMASVLENERARATEITNTVLSLKAQEVDTLQNRIQESFGFVPNEAYVGMGVSSNPPSLLHVRQQLEALARMTGKKSKDASIYALLDFVLRLREGFQRDTPVLGFILVHCINHWDCLRKGREDVLGHVTQGISVDLPSMLSSNRALGYGFTSMLYALHVFGLQLDGAGVTDPWRTDTIPLDNPADLPEIAEDQPFLSTILFLDKVRSLAATMYMELVFNVYEDLDPALRASQTAASASNWKAARRAVQSIVRVLETALEHATLNYWPTPVVSCFMNQLLFYVDAFWMNAILSQKSLCSKASVKELQGWLSDLDGWAADQKFVRVRECLRELLPFRQTLALLAADKAALAKVNESAVKEQVSALSDAQVRVLLKQGQEQATPVRVLRIFGTGGDGDVDEASVDKTMLYPIPVNVLSTVTLAEVTSTAFPVSISKGLADTMASATLVDDEYVHVQFDLSVFEIGDAMDNLVLEETSAWDAESTADLADLDEEQRSQLMLGQMRTGTTMVGGLPSEGVTYVSADALPIPPLDINAIAERAAAATTGESQKLREKVLARIVAKSGGDGGATAAPIDKDEEEMKALLGGASGVFEGEWDIGMDCDAIFLDDNQWYAAVIMDGPDPEGQFLVLFTEYGNEQWTPIEFIRAPLTPADASGGGGTESQIFSVLEPADDPFK